MSSERVFFALWPDERTRQQLSQLSQQLTQGISGRIIDTDNLHLTLVFIGSVDLQRRQCLETVASAIQAQRFTLVFDQLGYWRKPQIFWLGATHIPSALSTLVNQLTTELQVCGYQPESRPYKTHITLMRQVSSLPQPLARILPLSWSVETFCLLRSLTLNQGVHYQLINQWPLY
ncbi:MAG: RNA 2',3'-cyclic phosphodiesterase [Pseudomonadota bacterium]|nr:RNA 2',3'-cyclic phosphodiesterase [Pseudomonadota bacterium]